MKVELYDTTLRDGAQGEGISFSVRDKLEVTALLDDLGVHYIEGGWPGSNPKDEEYFRRVRSLRLRNSVVTAFSFVTRVGLEPGHDPNLAVLLAAETEVVTVVGKSWDLHVRRVLGTTLDENLRLIFESVRYLRSHDRRVFYDAEQFFDGYKANPEYALRTLRAAVDGGAEILVLCDTNGGTMPWEIGEIVSRVRESIGVELGIHAHNDCELAVANSLAAVRAGAVQVQGTVNGYGERVGNANLISIIPDLKLKMGVECIPGESLRRLTEVAQSIGQLANHPLDSHAPFVGRSAFAHKAGLHADATMKFRASYQQTQPELVGNRTRILVSELAGKGNVLLKAQEFAAAAQLGREEARRIAQRIKELEGVGFSFESADASVELLIRRERDGYVPAFEVIDYSLSTRGARDGATVCEAVARVRVAGQVVDARATGRDALETLAAALRRALSAFFPQVDSVQQTGFAIQVIDGDAITSARWRVLVNSCDAQARWTTVGCSPNGVDAIWMALVDAVEYPLVTTMPAVVRAEYGGGGPAR